MFTTSLQCSVLAFTQKGKEEKIFRDKLRNIAQYLIYNRTCHVSRTSHKFNSNNEYKKKEKV